MSPEEERFIEFFTEAIDGLEPGTVALETAFRELPVWDSLALLTTLAMIDGEYGVTLKGTELAACDSLADLWIRIQGG